MLTWWIAAALAIPPQGVAYDDAEVYEDATGALQDGPDGCWEVVGTASWDWDFGRVGYAVESAAFVGRLEDGEWQDFLIRSLGEDRKWRTKAAVRVFPHDEQRFVPLVGRRPAPKVEKGPDGDVLTTVLGELGGDVSYAWSEWDDDRDGVMLHRSIPFGDGGIEATMDVFFPQGGLTPQALTVDFPSSFSIPSNRLVRVRDATAKVRGAILDGQTIPEAEAFSFSAGILGFRMTGAQSIQYKTFRPCGGAVEDEAAPVTPATDR